MIRQKTTFKTHWSPERIKDFRKRYRISQPALAQLLKIAQQRVSDWENGNHSMKRSWTMLFDQLAARIDAIAVRSSGNRDKFVSYIEKEFSVEIVSEGEHD